jgi:hypothetical protein
VTKAAKPPSPANRLEGMTRFRYGIAALAAVSFLISGCAGGETTSTEAGAPLPASDRAFGGTGSSEAAGKALPEAAGKPLSEAAQDSVGESQQESTEQIKITQVDRAIIYTAQLTVRAKDVAAASDKAKQIETAAGGYVSDEKSDSYSQSNEAVITFKIPPNRYTDVLAQLGRNLGKRESIHQGAQDVTEEVADVESRVKSAGAALDQFRTLLTKANKIGEILEIEREISNREAELEALQARQKALAAQTGMATVTLSLVGPAAKLPEPEEGPSGFFGGLKAGWKSLVEAVEVGLTVLGALLPWLVVFAVIWLIVMTIWRRVRPRRTPPPPAPHTPPAPPVPSAPAAPPAPPEQESEKSSA